MKNIRSGFECLLNKLINIFCLLFISDYLVTTTLCLSNKSVIANYNLTFAFIINKYKI